MVRIIMVAMMMMIKIIITMKIIIAKVDRISVLSLLLPLSIITNKDSNNRNLNNDNYNDYNND